MLGDEFYKRRMNNIVREINGVISTHQAEVVKEEIIEVKTIKKNLEACGMLLIGAKEVQHLLDTITNLEKEVDYWRVNYNLKENVARELQEENEQLKRRCVSNCIQD